MKNITITLDSKIAAWLRLEAARGGKSVSRFVGDLVHEHMREARRYEGAMRRFLSHEPVHFEWAGGRHATRQEINDRAALREELPRCAPSPKNTR
jgi:hypothetical protein